MSVESPTAGRLRHMGKIHPKVTQLARDLGAVRSLHLSPAHRKDWLRAFARDLQVTVDSWFRGLPPADVDWPTWQAEQNAPAREASRALTESGDSIAHQGAK